MKFRPETSNDVTLDWLMRQFELIASEELHDLDVLHAAPAKVKVGKVVYADGTDWNPGSGEGAYVYTSGGWVKM